MGCRGYKGYKGFKGFKGYKVIVLAGFLVLASAISASAQGPRPLVPVIAELFTSEGCNSCPPADLLLEVLLNEQPIDGVLVVPMSEHVTYWDHQGWKDPFGSAQFTTRQQQYGRRFNVESIFTPQLIVDGSREMVGSDKRAIAAALQEAAKSPKPELKVNAGGTDATLELSATGAGLAVEKDAELWYAITEDRLVVDVKRGENANRRLKHSGVVRVLRSAGDSGSATPTSIKLDAAWKRDNLRVIGFVQSRKTRQILSVGYVELGAARH
ncbi:MAG TPA: DUF1223 domain-containing protein [Vicinamibacterales bacterium]